jgi:hypothetical protein
MEKEKNEHRLKIEEQRKKQLMSRELITVLSKKEANKRAEKFGNRTDSGNKKQPSSLKLSASWKLMILQALK